MVRDHTPSLAPPLFDVFGGPILSVLSYLSIHRFWDSLGVLMPTLRQRSSFSFPNMTSLCAPERFPKFFSNPLLGFDALLRLAILHCSILCVNSTHGGLSLLTNLISSAER
ncbi:hypothetical protein BLNAU_16759 [Blattamonas nauphoetae]|uniref:Uncharacterized protein n=1 Tax=Blattamonas nauphoetae TaxID=2049346 RepID=A0ABQ9XDL7_9EUKA|nr:hypothetical protein BLNAU_16759 [Blattamonas nauphoetae]